MDPLSIASACAGLISGLITTSTAIGRITNDARQMRPEVQAMQEEVTQLQGVTTNLEETLRQCDASDIPNSDGERLMAVITSCNAYLKVLRTTLDKYNVEAGPIRAASWALSGQGKVKDIRDKLAAQQDALSFMLVVLSV
jgi:hypothetical protein